MWKTISTKLIAMVILVFLMTTSTVLEGCGNNENTVDGSTITINPSTTTASIIDNTSYDYTVTVKYADGTPYPKAVIYITGSFAEPRNTANSTARYQFYYYPGGELNTTKQLKVDSGFYAQTDDYGNYRFSITVYGRVGGAANTFTDTINISSGSAFASHSLSIS